MRTAIAATATFFLLAGAAFAAPVTTVSTAKGDVLAGENGMTLYTFKNDKKGVSNCNGNCAKNWPPLAAADGDKGNGAYSVIERSDGSYQWAKNGMPLYFWVKDAKKGDTTGDGVNGVWDIARP